MRMLLLTLFCALTYHLHSPITKKVSISIDNGLITEYNSVSYFEKSTFECGINNYWKEKRFLLLKPEPLNSTHLAIDFDTYKLYVIDRGEKILLEKNEKLKGYLQNALAENISLYKVQAGRKIYFVLKANLAAATNYYTLMNSYLIFDEQRTYLYHFISLGSIEKTFFVKDNKLGFVEFDFSKLFIEKGIISINASVYFYLKSKKANKRAFLDCICK